jgi:sulfite exporter TauE/SafE
MRAAAAGGLWFAWPCGLLQSALIVAALANGAPGGAAAMAGFAVASAPGLWLGPWALRRWGLGGGAAAYEARVARAAGALLVAASAWALGHGVWAQVAAFCATL